MRTIQAIILAAGQGTRLKSQTPKVFHKLFGKSLLERVLCQLEALALEQVHLVVGHGRDRVQAEMSALSFPFPLQYVVQEPQLGTGHAVIQVKNAMAATTGALSLPQDILIATGDAPLLTSQSFQKLIKAHQTSDNVISLLVANLDNPSGYGRVVMEENQIKAIVEEKDTSFDQKFINTVNTGVYCIQWDKVSPLLDRLSTNNAQGEFYLTDIIALAVAEGMNVGGVWLGDPQEMTGVNSRTDLAVCYHLLNQKSQERLMAAGVTLVDPLTTVIGPEVEMGPDTIVYPGCYLEGDITIGAHCSIGPQTTLMGQVVLEDHVNAAHSYIKNSHIGQFGIVGPFAHIRDGSVLAEHVRIGNFVEVKNCQINHHTNAAHLAYLGDAILGSDVNMGAGSITANFDPIREEKHQTVIEDGVKVGCNAVLVAPLTLHHDSCVAAGSVITDSISPWNLAIARPKQTEILNWVSNIKNAEMKSAPASPNAPLKN
jgi:bifunctional UDP-N-acetylglucosamine pyrophosphorylase / glucosamine-1-phosphate N-acetyltransferase